jgi:hypothetical protein
LVRLFALITCLLFTQNSLAVEVYRNSLSANAARWTFFYGEDKKWIIENVSLDAEGWPKLEDRSIYQHADQARAALTSAAVGKVRSRRLPTAGEALRGSTGQTLWTVTNEWSWEWELKYAEWVKSEIHSGWWLKHGLATDCADVAYSAKWIFARNNGLPMHNRLASGQWFTHESVKSTWAGLPTHKEWHKDKKFLAALNYFLDHVFTHTLWNDSYPIAISPDSLRPGAHHLSIFGDTGHTQLVSQVGLRADEIPMLTLNSTVPRAQRELSEYIFLNQKADPAGNALLRMRWPETKNGLVGLKDASDMPLYSVEQFDANFVRSPRNFFWEEVFYRLNPGADFDLIGQKTAGQIVDLLKARVPIVEEGYRVCRAQPCRPGSADWEAWSTPSRDTRIRESILTYYNLRQFVTRPDQVEALLKVPIISQEGHTFTAAKLIMAFNMGLPSSDPNDDPVARWGAHPRAVGDQVLRKVGQSLSQRQSKIQSPHNCRDGTCIFGSDQFLRASSVAVDSYFSRMSQLIRGYCSEFGPMLCSELESLLIAHPLSANGRTLSVWDWLEESTHFNSDPRHLEERRYHGFEREFPHYAFSGPLTEVINSFAGRLFFNGVNLLFIQGVDFRPWNMPAGEKIENLDSTEGWIWTSMGSFLLARKDPNGAPLRISLPGNPVKTIAYGGHLLVQRDDFVHLLRAQDGAILEIGQFPRAEIGSAETGYAILTNEGSESWLVDMKLGVVVALPELPASMETIQRTVEGDYFLKYNSYTEGRVLCQILARDGSVADLNPTGNCINYAHAEGLGIFEVNGRAVKRTFDGGLLLREEDVGGLGDYYSDRLLKTVDRARYRYFCFAGGSMVEMQRPPDALDLTSCNDRYVIEAVAMKDWRVRERATGRIMLRTQDYISFASPADQEAYVFSGSWSPSGAAFGLFDLRRPERFSVLTGEQMSSFYGPYDRDSGLLVFKGSRLIWLAD